MPRKPTTAAVAKPEKHKFISWGAGAIGQLDNEACGEELLRCSNSVILGNAKSRSKDRIGVEHGVANLPRLLCQPVDHRTGHRQEASVHGIMG